MNKKLLFAALSLAVFTACTDDNFESQKQLAQETVPVEFEVINTNDATTRASMDTENGTAIKFSAVDHDLFTLYHGCPDAFGDNAAGPWTKGYDNATYTAEKATGNETKAKLTTPTMIKTGAAIMVWPADTTFRITPALDLTIQIPTEQGDINRIAYQIPVVSDLVQISGYGAYTETGDNPTAWNTAGYNRKYPVYMRPMASQVDLKPNYIGKDKIDALTTGDDPVHAITIDNIELHTGALAVAPAQANPTNFTTEIKLQFANPSQAQQTAWNTFEPKNAWKKVTSYGAVVNDANKLTSTAFDADRDICKFLFLPLGAAMAQDDNAGVEGAAIVVNTYYGQVIVGTPDIAVNIDNVNVPGRYLPAEIADAWYRYAAAETPAAAQALPQEGEALGALQAPNAAEGANKYKITSTPEFGMQQTLNWVTNHTTGNGTLKNEPNGGATNRWLNVYLKYLDMSNLHITSDQQLRDVVRVWKELGLASVMVYLDGGTTGKFQISQKTIKTINDMNAAQAADNKVFTVTPCAKDAAGHPCNEIIVTGASEISKIQDMEFIVYQDGNQNSGHADVVLNAGENWIWDGTVMVAPNATTGITNIINRGTMGNSESKILNILFVNGDATAPSNITFVNDLTGVWGISKNKTIRVQNTVKNLGTLIIGENAQYRQDGNILAGAAFTNDAVSKEGGVKNGLPDYYGGQNEFGVVNNMGVFAVIGGGVINNYGLIEHQNKNAMTFITANQTENADFKVAFGANNKIGRINLPYSNKDEDNISIDAALEKGFVSVTIDGEVTGELNNTSLGDKVNYVIIKSGVTDIANLNPIVNNVIVPQVKYLEINKTDKSMVAWKVNETTAFTGLMVLSDVNIKIYTTVTATATYLKSDATMYVGGVFNRNAIADPATLATDTDNYFGNTTENFNTNYVTFE